MPEPKMIVVGTLRMLCTRCSLVFDAQPDPDAPREPIVRHGDRDNPGPGVNEGWGDWLQSCPLAGKSFRFPEAIPSGAISGKQVIQ
jgi:hypothetical protein